MQNWPKQLAQMFCFALLYVEDLCPGGPRGPRGPRGDHIMRMMALLSWVPSQKTRRAGIQNMLRCTKDISLVGPWLNELSLGWKNKTERFSFCVRQWPFEYHTRRRPLIWQRSRCSRRSSRQRGGHVGFLRLWDDWCPSSLCGDCRSKAWVAVAASGS